MQVILIFTYGISLKDWKDNGLLDREISIYEEVSNNFNVKFTFLTFGNELDENLVNNQNISVIPIYKYIKKSNVKYLNYFKTLVIPFKLKKQLKAIDLIKTNQLNGSWLGIILKYVLKKPLYVRTGYNIYEFKKLQNKPFYVVAFYRYLTKLAYFASEIFSVTSSVDLKKISSICKNNTKIIVIKNYVNNISNNVNKMRIVDRLFSVGRLEPQKNFTSLINILSRSDFGLDIVGKGSLEKELINTANKNGVELNLFNSLEHGELLAFYTKYKYFVLNSDYEGNPKVVLEALASGCVVICKDNINVREVIINNENGFLYKDENELLNILNNIEKNQDLCEYIISNGFKTIKENYILSLIVEKEIEVYKKLIY